jgi:superoxide dismutase
MAEQINKDFGSFEKWQAEFRACGVSARGPAEEILVICVRITVLKSPPLLGRAFLLV